MEKLCMNTFEPPTEYGLGPDTGKYLGVASTEVAKCAQALSGLEKVHAKRLKTLKPDRPAFEAEMRTFELSSAPKRAALGEAEAALVRLFGGYQAEVAGHYLLNEYGRDVVEHVAAIAGRVDVAVVEALVRSLLEAPKSAAEALGGRIIERLLAPSWHALRQVCRPQFEESAAVYNRLAVANGQEAIALPD
jgi:hypothetical protein